MPLKIQGSVIVDAPREDVYAFLLDPELLKRVIGKIPGVTLEHLEKVSETEFAGRATVGVAMVKGTYDGKILVLEQRPFEFIRLRGDGKGGGNWTTGEATLSLIEQEGQTRMDYLGQGNVTGQLASVGQRLIDTVGRQFVDQGVKAFAEEIAAQRREKLGLAPVPKPPRALPAWAIPAAFALLVLLAALVYYLATR